MVVARSSNCETSAKSSGNLCQTNVVLVLDTSTLLDSLWDSEC